VRGNRSLPETGALWWKDGLVHLAKTELDSPWLFNMRGSKFVEETLQADLIAMRNVYRDLGWLDAVVELDPPLEFTPDRSGVTIHIRVDEGEPYVVSKLSIRGVTRTLPAGVRDLEKAEETDAALLFGEDVLLAQCKLHVGQRYKRAQQQLDSAALRKFYGERGYLAHSSLDPLTSFVVLEPELLFDKTGRKVEVTYKLQQGTQRYIREVLFSGSEYTRDRVLRREVDVKPGEVANSEEINRSLSRIYQTDYFSGNPSDDHREPAYRFVAQTDPKWLDLVYTVQEGRVVDFMINGGVDSNNGLVGRLSLQMRNFDARNLPSSFWSTFGEIYEKQAFHGAGQTLQLDLAPGTQTSTASIRFIEPDLFGTHLDRYSLDVGLSTNRRLWSFYDEDRDRMSVRIGREFGRKLMVTAGLVTQLIDITDIEAPLNGIDQPDEPSVPPALTAQAGESALNGATLDFKYMQVDNRLNPYQGLSVNWRNALYGGALGGDWNFLRSQVDIDAYFVLGHRDEDHAQPGFKTSLGFGIADPMGDSELVPYTERFFLGGLNTLRGFKNRGVGPNTNGEPDGGESMLSGSLEYRIPLSTQTEPGTYREREVFRFLLFADAGVLNNDPYTLDFDELRTSVGFGIGMAYPLPINLYFGFPIREGDGDQGQTFGFNISSFGF
jgi:outer membrane protein insertion porin family